MRNVSLSTHGLKYLNYPEYLKDFIFIVNGKKFPCCRFVADFLSPKVSKLHFSDVSISEITINTKSNGNFKHILELGYGEQFFINDSNRVFLEEISIILENEELFILAIENTYDADKIDLDKISPNEDQEENGPIIQKMISNLNKKRNFFKNASIQDEIDSISKIFYKINTDSDLKLIDYNLMYQIITNSNLRIKCEDQLLSVILMFSKTNPEFFSLLEFVKFENITNESTIEQFVEQFEISFLNQKIWCSLCSRLKSKIRIQKQHQRHRYFSQLFEEDDNGIIKYFQTLASSKLIQRSIKQNSNENSNENSNQNYNINTNVNTNGNNNNHFNLGQFNGYLGSLSSQNVNKEKQEIDLDEYLKVTASSGDPRNVLNGQQFSSTNIPNSWLLFDFGDKRKVCLTGYSLRCFSTVSYNMRSWTVEGSNDLCEWIELDSQITNKLNEARVMKRFDVKKNKFDNEGIICRYIRLRHTGYNGTSTAQLFLGGIEFFGELYE